MLKKVLQCSEKSEFLIPEGAYITELSNTPEDSDVPTCYEPLEPECEKGA